MHDIDDFDPLDDILLSDDEAPQSKPVQQSALSLPKPSEDQDDISKKNKKKKVFAELFGIEEDADDAEKRTPISSTSSKSDWLDLKDDNLDPAPNPNSTFSSATTADREERRRNYDPIIGNQGGKHASEVKEKSVHFADNANVDRRKSEDNIVADNRRAKPRYKSLDLDLDFDTPVPSTSPSNDATQNEETSRSDTNFETDSLYTPSRGILRRTGISRSRYLPIENQDLFSVTAPEKLENLNSDSVRDALPSWLDTKTETKSPSHNRKSAEVPHAEGIKPENTSTTTSSDEVKSTTEPKTNNNEDESTAQNKIRKSQHFVSTVQDLVKKQEELKQLAKSQVESLSQYEQEIQNSAYELIQQQRDSITALLQIVSFDDVVRQPARSLPEKDAAETYQKEEIVRSTVSQLQTKLIENELEISELEMKLKHAERRHNIDLTMLEDVYKYKLHAAEERETYFRNEMQLMEAEFNTKFSKRKETEEEIIRTYNEKIRVLREEHLNEMKQLIEFHNLKSSLGNLMPDKNDRMKSEQTISKELTIRELAAEDKEKQLLVLEEHVNREKTNLETKKASFETRIEEFETKVAKEQLHIEQQRKDLKLAQNIFEEKKTYWEHEKQREKEYLTNYKQELEVLKEKLLDDERKLMKEKYQVTTERARLEAIVNSEGYSGDQINDVMQTKAELQGTIEEVRRLKVKLESERNEIKNEEIRLKEESWRLRDIEQELALQHKHFQKVLHESELKREEGIQALKRAQLIESQMDERVKEVERRMMELSAKEELLTKEKIEVSKERELLNKKRYQLDMILPQLSYEEQLPFNLLSKNIVDPRVMLLKLKAENDLDSLLRQ